MPRNLWSRVSLVAVVVLGSVWHLYPPQRTINLGLDLQGGIHLVLGVEVDKALENVVERSGGDIRVALEKKGIGAQVTRPSGSSTDLVIQLTSPAAFKEAQNVLA